MSGGLCIVGAGDMLNKDVSSHINTVDYLYCHLLTLIYVAVGLYDTHSFEWPNLLKVPMYKNSETICIPSPKHCLSIYAFKFMKQ